jgi:hypothetical protein
MKLQLKKEYQGQIITKRFIGIGNVSMDTTKLDSRRILNFYRNGFTEYFEYVEEEIETGLFEFTDGLVDLFQSDKEKQIEKMAITHTDEYKQMMDNILQPKCEICGGECKDECSNVEKENKIEDNKQTPLQESKSDLEKTKDQVKKYINEQGNKPNTK